MRYTVSTMRLSPTICASRENAQLIDRTVVVAQRVEPAADAAGDAELGIVGIARVGQRARVRAVDQVVGRGARLQRGGEHEQLDARSGLARRQRQVDLALTGDEPAPAHHRPDRAGLGVERRDRGVDPERVVGQLVAGLLGARLHERVERGVDAEAAAVQARVALLVGVAEDVAPVEEVVAQRLAVVRALARPLRPALHALGQDERVRRRVEVDLRDEPVARAAGRAPG